MTSISQVSTVFLLVILVIVNVVEGCEERSKMKSYSGYQLLEMTGGTLGKRQVSHLETIVDFWNSPYENSTSFLVEPKQLNYIKKYLNNQNVQYNVIIRDLGKEIRREHKENCQGFTSVLSRGKRASIWDNLWTTLTRGSHRTPRKIEEFDNSGSASGAHGILQRELPPVSIPSNSLLNFVSPKLVVESGVDMDWDRYHRLGTIYSWMHQLSTSYPDLIRLMRIGVTEEGRGILLAHVGTAQSVTKPAIFIEGGIHAREWVSPASVTHIINELVTNPEYQDLVNYYDFFILPVANPDGYEFSHTRDRMWRKNRSHNKGVLNLLGTCNGVDLNRNFGYHWGDASILAVKEGSRVTCLETYMGESAFSEKESQAVRDFVLARRNRIVSYLSFHSFGSKILYPFSYTHEKVVDWKELHHMANNIASAVFQESRGEDYYKIGTASDIQYEASGGSDDWARGGAGIKWVYLIELPGRRHGFLLPPKHIKHVARTSMAALHSLAAAIAETL